MGNKISQPSGYSIKDVENQEMMRVRVEEEKPLHTITSSSSSTNSGNIWRSVKPFVSGGIAGLLTQMHSYLLFADVYDSEMYTAPRFAAEIKKIVPSNQAYNVFRKRIPGVLLLGASYTSLLLGSFEVLTRKVNAANKGMQGMPLTLFQEACCGLTSGAIAACIGVPFSLALIRMRRNHTCPSILQDLYHKAANEGVSALWKGGRPLATAMIATNMGVLVPYNRCSVYLRESLGLNETDAKRGAAVFSGFFGAACCSSSLNCAFKIFKSEGLSPFIIHYPKIILPPIFSITMMWLAFDRCQMDLGW